MYRAHSGAVRSFVHRRARPAVADDVVAEVFVLAWRRLDQAPGDELAWLLGIARGVLANRRRGDARQQALHDRLAAGTVRGVELEPEGSSEDSTLMAALRCWQPLPVTSLAVTVAVSPRGRRGSDRPAGLAAARASEQDVLVLRELVEEVKAAAEDHGRTIEADARLHHLIAGIADNRLAGAFSAWIVDVLQPRLVAVIEPAVVVSVIAEQHRDLLEAIARGDPTSAERAMREHLVYLRDVVNAVEPAPPGKLSTEAGSASEISPRS